METNTKTAADTIRATLAYAGFNRSNLRVTRRGARIAVAFLAGRVSDGREVLRDTVETALGLPARTRDGHRAGRRNERRVVAGAPRAKRRPFELLRRTAEKQRPPLKPDAQNADRTSMQRNTNTKPVTFRITAEHVTGGVKTLARSKSLKALSRRIERDAEFWDRLGWECLTLEDNSIGDYTETLKEALHGMFKRGEITFQIFKFFAPHCA